MRRPALDSMLLASLDPEGLGDWYAALDPEEDVRVNGYRVLRLGSLHLLIDRRDDISASNPEPGRMILNLDGEDAPALVGRRNGMGVTRLARLEDRDGSLFATAVDPDGNYVQLIELSEDERAAMQPG